MRERESHGAGRGLILLVAAVTLAQSLLAWGFNYWQKDFVDALSNRQAQAFYFSLKLLGVILLVEMGLSWLHDTFQPRLTNRLRASRFSRLAALYFGEQRFLTRTQMTATAQHDPAQRLVDDLRDWAGLVVQLASGALGAVAKLLLFSYTLCQVMPQLPFFGITVPYPMLFLALISFGLSAGLIHWVGRRLPDRETARSNREADLRTHVAHMQSQAAAIALLRGAAVEQTLAQTKLGKVLEAVRSLATIQARVGVLAILLGPGDILAIIVLSPFLFNGDLTYGQVFQIGMAHGTVGAALNWFVSGYGDWARLRALRQRLNGWQTFLKQQQVEAATLHVTTGNDLRVHDLVIAAPSQNAVTAQVICRIPGLFIERGEKVVLRAPSGFGKSVLFMLLSGNWPWAKGSVSLPTNKVFMPQKPYFPFDTLFAALCYPKSPSPVLRTQTEQALHALNLSAWLARLDESADWGSQLSGGEQALAGLIRAWLQASEWVLMDEPNAALDPASAERFWGWVRTWRDRTIVIISHQPIPGGLGFRQVDW